MSASDRCPCRCHHGSVVPEGAPLLTDVIAAATACDRCLGRHSVVFLRATMPEAPVRHTDGEGPETL